MKILIVTLLLACVAITYAKNYAVLVATSKTHLFYRHQSSVLRAYHTLVGNGIPKDNIITMFYDDLAKDPKNPEPGVIRNHPTGPNVYAGVKKDYTGDKVTAKNFLAILNGDKSASGPVLKSGPKDNVYIYVCGLGSNQVITFPSGPALTASEFVDALKKLRSSKRAAKVFVDLETPKASTMVEGLVPRKDHILVSVATLAHEYPWAVFCSKEKRLCYGSLYGSAWNARSERYRQLKSGARVSIFDRFSDVRTLTVYSQVHLYGHYEMGSLRMKQFLGYKKQKKMASGVVEEMVENALDDAEAQMEGDSDVDQVQVQGLKDYVRSGSIRDAGMDLRGDADHIMMNELDIPAFMAEHEEAASQVLKNRHMVDETVKQIFNQLDAEYDAVDEPNTHLSAKVSEDYSKAIMAFSENCFSIHDNTYAQTHLGKFASLIQKGVSVEKLTNAMQQVCTPEHRQMKSIH